MSLPSAATEGVELTTEDCILLRACRRYMAATDIDTASFCRDLFDLASQALDHLGDEFEEALAAGVNAKSDSKT